MTNDRTRKIQVTAMKRCTILSVIALLAMFFAIPAIALESGVFIAGPAAVYDVCADIDPASDAGREQAKAIFTEMRAEFGDGDVLFRICRDDSAPAGMSLCAEWESAAGVIIWHVSPPECEEWEPEIIPEEKTDDGVDYVLNTNTGKFHYPSCSSVEDMKEKNRADFHGTREELIDMGYSPCGRCKP